MKTLYVVSLVTAMCMGLSASLSAQAPIRLDHDVLSKQIQPFGGTEFAVHVTNITSSEISISVLRIENALSSGDWYSAICCITKCYPSTVDAPDPVLIPANETRDVKLIIGSGADGWARVQLKFTVGDYSVTKQFYAGVGSSAVHDDTPGSRIMNLQ